MKIIPEILKYHYDNRNELTIVSALKNYPIPYGTIKTKEGGILEELIEKPELNFSNKFWNVYFRTTSFE